MTSRTIDYHKESKTTSNYKFSLVNPQSGGNEVTLRVGVQKQVRFELPSRAFNFSRSYLNFDFVVPAQTTITSTATVFRDVMGLIDSMRLVTSAGVELMSLSQFRMFTKLLKKDIAFELYKTLSKDEWLAPNRGNADRGEMYYYTGAASTDHEQPIYLRIAGTIPQAGNVDSQVVSVRFPLGRLIGTIFELDKSLYFPESIFLHMVMGAPERAAFRCNSDNNPHAGAALLETATDFTISNLHLLLAIETNQAIIQSLMDTVNGEGMSVLVPTTYAFENTVGAQQQTITIRLSAAQGQKLRRIYHTCIGEATAAIHNQQYDISNGAYVEATNLWTPTNVSSYYVMLDNNRISGEMDITCADGMDWLVNREHLKGSIIKDIATYKREWHHQEDFSGIRESPYEEKEGADKDNISGGLDLINKERKIDLFFRMNNTLRRNHYTFAEVERTLFISQNAIGLDVNALPVSA